MKHSRRRVTSLLCGMALLTAILAGCGKDGIASAESSGNPQEAASVSSAVPEPADPGPQTDPELWEMDYETYFSKEHKWVDESMIGDDDRFFEAMEDGSVRGYRWKESGDRWVKIDPIVLPREVGFVNECTTVKRTLVSIVDGNRIIQTDLEGENPVTLFEGDKPLSMLRANRSLLFFLEDGRTICRIHRQSGTLDRLVHSEKPIDSYSPISSDAVLWAMITPEYKAFIAAGNSYEDKPKDMVDADQYLYNHRTGEQRVITKEDYNWEGYLLYQLYEIDED